MSLLDLNAQATTRLGLEPIKNPAGGYLYEGCVPALVTDFHVTMQKPHEKGEFKGLEVPVLTVEFENLKLKPTDPDRYYTHTFKIIGTKQLVKGTSDSYENRPEVDIISDTTDLWKTIKHFLESLTDSPNYRNIVNIPKEDVVKYFDLPGIAAPEERIKAYKAFFDYLVKFVVGDGEKTKSQLLNAESKPLPLWLKMLPNYDKDPKRNAKYYVISRFIGQGVYEPLKIDKGNLVPPKRIKVKPSESLALIPNVPGVGAAGAPGSTALPGNVGPIDSAVVNLLS